MTTLSTTLLTARHNLNLAQFEVANEIGVTAALVCFWEKGTSVPQYDHLRKLAHFLKLDYKTLCHQAADAWADSRNSRNSPKK